MNDDINFVDGIFFKVLPANAPDWVIAKGSINKTKMLAQLNAMGEDEWLNFETKLSKAGKPYTVVDDWKPKEKAPRTDSPPDDFNQGIPF